MAIPDYEARLGEEKLKLMIGIMEHLWQKTVPWFSKIGTNLMNHSTFAQIRSLFGIWYSIWLEILCIHAIISLLA